MNKAEHNKILLKHALYLEKRPESLKFSLTSRLLEFIGIFLICVHHFRYLGYELNTRASLDLFVTHLLKAIRCRTPMLKSLLVMILGLLFNQGCHLLRIWMGYKNC